MAPVSRGKTGASASTETVNVDLVADIYPAEAGHPSPAARSDHAQTIADQTVKPARTS